jgi:hypothetical protein
MPLSVPSGFGLLSYMFSLSGDPETMVTTTGLAIAGDPLEAVNNRASIFMSNTTAAQLGGGWTFRGCQLRTGGAGATGAIFEAPRSLVGAGNPSGLPNNCSYLLKKITDLTGRRGRGRFYIPPYLGGEDQVSPAGVITESTRVALLDYFVLAIPVANTVLLHDTLPNVMAPTPIVTYLLDTRIATQRRRLR